MNLRRKNMLCVGVLVCCALVSCVSSDSYRYYYRYHSDNSYQRDMIPKFSVEVEEKDLSSIKFPVYKVLVRRGRAISAEKFYQGDNVGSYEFDSVGRVKGRVKNKVQCKWEYGAVETVVICFELGVFVEKRREIYSDNMLFKIEYFDKNDDLIRYTLFDYEEYVFAEYDSLGRKIFQGNMVPPGR